MTMKVVISPDYLDLVLIELDKVGLENMKLILARACNVWPDAPPEIKEYHDTLIHGRVLQDYYSQPKFTRREELSSEENSKLDSWASENKEPGT